MRSGPQQPPISLFSKPRAIPGSSSASNHLPDSIGFTVTTTTTTTTTTTRSSVPDFLFEGPSSGKRVILDDMHEDFSPLLIREGESYDARQEKEHEDEDDIEANLSGEEDTENLDRYPFLQPSPTPSPTANPQNFNLPPTKNPFAAQTKRQHYPHPQPLQYTEESAQQDIVINIHTTTSYSRSFDSSTATPKNPISTSLPNPGRSVFKVPGEENLPYITIDLSSILPHPPHQGLSDIASRIQNSEQQQATEQSSEVYIPIPEAQADLAAPLLDEQAATASGPFAPLNDFYKNVVKPYITSDDKVFYRAFVKPLVKGWEYTKAHYVALVFAFLLAIIPGAVNAFDAFDKISSEQLFTHPLETLGNMPGGDIVFSILNLLASVGENGVMNIKFLAEALDKIKDMISRIKSWSGASTFAFSALIGAAVFVAAFALGFVPFAFLPYELGAIPGVVSGLGTLLSRFLGVSGVLSRVYNLLKAIADFCNSDKRLQAGAAEILKRIKDEHLADIKAFMDTEGINLDDHDNEQIKQLFEHLAQHPDYLNEKTLGDYIKQTTGLLFNVAFAGISGYFAYYLFAEKGFQGFNIFAKEFLKSDVLDTLDPVWKILLGSIPGAASVMFFLNKMIDAGPVFIDAIKLIISTIKTHPENLFHFAVILGTSILSGALMKDVGQGVVDNPQNIFGLTDSGFDQFRPLANGFFGGAINFVVVTQLFNEFMAAAKARREAATAAPSDDAQVREKLNALLDYLSQNLKANIKLNYENKPTNEAVIEKNKLYLYYEAASDSIKYAIKYASGKIEHLTLTPEQLDEHYNTVKDVLRSPGDNLPRDAQLAIHAVTSAMVVESLHNAKTEIHTAEPSLPKAASKAASSLFGCSLFMSKDHSSSINNDEERERLSQGNVRQYARAGLYA